MINIPSWSKELFNPYRYKVLYGGRGSAKSETIARCLLIIGSNKKIRVLCGREFQNSIAESVHKLLSNLIADMELSNFYSATNDRILGKNGTEFVFKGVRQNLTSLKSMAGITHLWLEEAQAVSQESWDVLIPTIREEGSEIWVSFNPDKADDPTYKMFVEESGVPKQRDDTFCLKVNWQQNPWFPQVLKKEKDYLFKVDPDLAVHIWEGQTRTYSDAQVFKGKWTFREFEVNENWQGPYYGADWGFSIDPTTLVRMYVDTENRKLYIRQEAYGVHTELEDLPELFDKVEGSRKHVIRADSARPETISFMQRKRFNIQAAKKGKGSVEEGIQFMRSFTEIVIHTDCPHTRDEFKNYSFKADRLTGDVTTDIIDAHNHIIDSCRYGLEPMISGGGLSILDVL